VAISPRTQPSYLLGLHRELRPNLLRRVVRYVGLAVHACLPVPLTLSIQRTRSLDRAAVHRLLPRQPAARYSRLDREPLVGLGGRVRLGPSAFYTQGSLVRCSAAQQLRPECLAGHPQWLS